MAKKYLTGIELNHSSKFTKKDTDLLVEYISTIEYEHDFFDFIDITINKKRYLCIQVDENTKLPKELKNFYIKD